MKKIILLKLLFTITVFCPAQKFLMESPFNSKMENVTKIVERKFGKWKEKSFFNDKGLLTKKLNFRKGKKRNDYQYDYLFLDTLFVVTQLKNNDSTKCLYYHISYDNLENYTLIEFYSSLELNVPSVIGTNFIYENGLLISYDMDGSVEQFQYDSLARITQMIFISGVSSDTTYTYYIYDRLGRQTDCIVESSNSEEIFEGVFVYSSEKRNKVHYRYSDFDKYGNWRKSYFITEKGDIFRSKRKIKYKIFL